MKKIVILLLAAFSFTTAGCLKDTSNDCNQNLGNPTAPASEVTALESYLASAGITTAVKHSSGMYYQIIDAGTGVSPNQCNLVAVRYTGRLTDGTIFDQATTPAVFGLSNLIMGWRIGIPLIKVGGTIRLFIPPSLAYGNRQVGTIPPNSMLIFDIDLVNVG